MYYIQVHYLVLFLTVYITHFEVYMNILFRMHSIFHG
jgi:hypothetical protein